MADEAPILYVGIYRGAEDGEDNIKLDPFLIRKDPIEAAIFKTRAMAIARGEFEIRKAQKIVNRRTVTHTANRFEQDNDEGKVFRVNDYRAEIDQEICIAENVLMEWDMEGGFRMSTEMVNFVDVPTYFAREIVFYAG